MLKALAIHPDMHCDAATRIEVGALRAGPSALSLRYVVIGAIDDLILPEARRSARTDELWRRTCFEAFMRAAPDAAYAEFNFAPSTEWAAYRFSGYRAGKSVAREIVAPRIAVQATHNSFTLQASVDLSALPDLSSDAPWRLGLSAVIEEANGRLSYWALAHPPGKPDFHHSDCFTLELAPASRA
ncbi:MAG: DOMON-like domain-containing protein [Parvularculaceae bacterium]